MCFAARHHLALRAKIVIFGLGGTLFDVGSDVYNGALFLREKNVTRTIPAPLDVPDGCAPVAGAGDNATYNCLEASGISGTAFTS